MKNRIVAEETDYLVSFLERDTMADEVLEKLIEYYKKVGCYNGESLQQSDEAMINAPDVLSEIADNIIKFIYWGNDQ